MQGVFEILRQEIVVLDITFTPLTLLIFVAVSNILVTVWKGIMGYE